MFRLGSTVIINVFTSSFHEISQTSKSESFHSISDVKKWPMPGLLKHPKAIPICQFTQTTRGPPWTGNTNGRESILTRYKEQQNTLCSTRWTFNSSKSHQELKTQRCFQLFFRIQMKTLFQPQKSLPLYRILKFIMGPKGKRKSLAMMATEAWQILCLNSAMVWFMCDQSHKLLAKVQPKPQDAQLKMGSTDAVRAIWGQAHKTPAQSRQAAASP